MVDAPMSDVDYIAYLELRLAETEKRLDAAHRTMATNVATLLALARLTEEPPTTDPTERPPL